MGADRPAAQGGRVDPRREPHRRAHHARQPQVLQQCAGEGRCRMSRRECASGALARGRGPLQVDQRHLRAHRRRPRAAVRGEHAQAERQGSGRGCPLRRRGVRGDPAAHAAARSGRGRRPVAARGDEGRTDPPLDRREAVARDHLDRRGSAAQPHDAAGAARSRRCLPLCRQAQRPQLRRRREGRAAAYRDDVVAS